MNKKSRNMFVVLVVIVVLAGLFWWFQNNNYQNYNIQTSSGSNFYGDSGGVSEIRTGDVFSVVSCSPSAPYDVCSGYRDTYGTVTTETRLNTYKNIQCEKSSTGQCIKRIWYGGKLVIGDKFYYTDSCYENWDYFWRASGCNENGCQLNQVSNTYEITLATTGQSYSGCPTVVVWDYSSDSGWWAYSYSGWGWGGNGTIPQVVYNNLPECYNQADCGAGKYCSGNRCVVNPICTSWTYSPWSPSICPVSQQQTRTVSSSSPANCIGGSPVLNQSCTYVAPICVADSLRCVGTTQERCNTTGSAWISLGQIDGQCGYFDAPTSEPEAPVIDLVSVLDDLIISIIQSFMRKFL